MSAFIAEHVFNPFLARFLETYCTSFPQCTHCKIALKDQLAVLKPEFVTYFLDLFYDSTAPFESELMAKDDKFFAHPENTFVKHLQINRIWTTELKSTEKDTLWGFLISCYLIAQAKVKLSPKLVDLITTVLQSAKKEQDVKQTVDLPFIQEQVQLILSQVDVKEIKVVGDYLTLFFSHEDTPVYELVPEQYHTILRIAIGLMQSPEQQEMLKQLMEPALEGFAQKMETELDITGDLTEEDLKDGKKMKDVFSLLAGSVADYDLKGMMENPQAALAKHGPALLGKLQEQKQDTAGLEAIAASFGYAVPRSSSSTGRSPHAPPDSFQLDIETAIETVTETEMVEVRKEMDDSDDDEYQRLEDL